MIGYFARHPIAANLLLIAGLYLGYSALPQLERERLPEFTSSVVTVSVPYPGATAQDVDEEICAPLSDALNGVTSLEALQCLSVSGVGRATLEMTAGGDIGQFYNDISSGVSAISDFPDSAEKADIAIAGQTELIALVAISGIDDVEELARYADVLTDRLSYLPGVATANVSGVSNLEYQIQLDELALRKLGISAKTVADAVSGRSVQTPLGTVKTDGRDITLRVSDARRSVSELEDLVILQNDVGAMVRLRDIANIALVPAQDEQRAEINGARAAIIAVNKTKADDAINAFTAIDALLVEERTRYAGGLELTVINNRTEGISEQIQLVLSNGLQSLILVMLVMCLFFSLSDAFWISMALPFSFAIGLWVMLAMGMTINMISLLALLMAIGLIMDDSIVIAENIAKWRERVPPVEAAIKGTQEVMGGVVSSFLTTAGVFGPLTFITGEIGSILRVIPIVLVVTMAVSLFEAFFILPRHLSHSTGDPAKNAQRFLPRNFERLKEVVILPTVKRFIAFRYLTVGCVFGILIFAIGLIPTGVVNVVGFPESESDTIEARIALTPGSQLDRSRAIAQQLVDGIAAVDGKLTPNTVSGQPLVERVLVQYSKNNDVNDNGAHTFTVTVDLLSTDLRNVRADDVLIAWSEATGPIADLVQSNFTQAASGPGGSDIDLELQSRDLVQLQAAAQAMRDQLAVLPHVTSVFQDFARGKPEVRLSLNSYGYTLGLTPQSLAGQLRTAFNGSKTDSFREGLSNFEVQVLLGDSIANMAELEAFPIILGSGEQVSLARIANLTEATSYSQITRENGLAKARIIGQLNLSATTVNEIAAIALDELAPAMATAFPDVVVVVGAAQAGEAETQASIIAALSTGLIAVYLILAFQFRSYTLPLVIMISIPFALIGVIFGHIALGMNLSMPSFIGFASLAGVVVNNAILFMGFFEKNIRNGDYETAALEAVRHRFRPVILSSLTTFIGLIPIVFETSASLQIIVPVVVSVAFGLLASMLLVIFVLPSVIAIYFDFKNVNAWTASKNSHSDDNDELAAVRI